MDKFLTKTPREPKNLVRKPPEKRRKKQARLPDLKGVVILERVEAAKRIFKDDSVAPDLILTHLRQLHQKTPAADVLIRTKIGKAVKRLCKHPNEEVELLAKDVVSKWTRHIRYVRTRQALDVKSDKPTEQRRQTARRLLGQALTTAESTLVTELERRVFFACGKSVRISYPLYIRNLVSKLKIRPEISNALLNGTLSIQELIDQCNSK